MMIIDLDIGNSRFKYRMLNKDDSSVSGVGDSLALSEPSAVFYQNLIPGALVRVGAVGNKSWLKQLHEQAEVRGAVLWVAATSHRSELLWHAYTDPSQLGVDRWLAMLAARQKFEEQRLLVVDAGSALTIDVIDKNQHLGGYICSGITLNRNSLGDQWCPRLRGVSYAQRFL
jgi:type III pantothenate kinase